METPGFSLNRVVHELPAGFASLQAAASAEGFLFLQRLEQEWISGGNRFDEPGEILLDAVQAGELVGIGGLARDPNMAEALRFRRFYVLPSARGQGIATAIVEEILKASGGAVRLFTVHPGTKAATRFWQRVGFHPLPNSELLGLTVRETD